MFNEKIFDKIKDKFPDFKVKYKNESLLMKLISNILFFNKKFMTSFTTTLGSTIYFPSKQNLNITPITSLVILMHEVLHISDSKRQNKYLFGILYLFPQILALLAIPLLLMGLFKMALFCLLFLLPLPAYFRMLYEKRAYLTSLYVMNKLNEKYKFNINLNEYKKSFVNVFKSSSYYYMWWWDLSADFELGLAKILANQKPFEDPIFEVLDELLEDFFKKQ